MRLSELATDQEGVVAWWQLKAMGFSQGAVRRRTERARLHARHRAVYSVGHRRLTRKGRLMAAVLAHGPGAVLSHRSAIELWELRPASIGPIDVTVRASGRRNRKGIRVHNVRRLDPADCTTKDGIPVTTIHRALLDYAEVAHRQQLRLAFDAAERLELFDLREMEAVIARNHGRHGIKAILAVLAEIQGPAPWTRSELERRFIALVRAAGLPEPQVNVIVEGYQVDFYWPKRRVIAELDGYEFHKSRNSFHGDRRRDTKLQVARIAVVRITQPRVRDEPAELMRDLTALLSDA